MALFKKQELGKNKNYQSFLSRCHQCRQEIQQTELYFLLPPAQRNKSRYFNLDSLVNWDNAILLYEQKQDFTYIDARYVIDEETLSQLAFVLDTNQLKSLWSLPKKFMIIVKN